MNDETYEELLKKSLGIGIRLETLMKESKEITVKMEKMQNDAFKVGDIKIPSIELKVYSMIYRRRSKNITELGIGKDDNGNKIYHYLCHSCEVGLRSHSHDSIVLQMVSHLSGERHMILLEDY